MQESVAVDFAAAASVEEDRDCEPVTMKAPLMMTMNETCAATGHEKGRFTAEAAATEKVRQCCRCRRSRLPDVVAAAAARVGRRTIVVVVVDADDVVFIRVEAAVIVDDDEEKVVITFNQLFPPSFTLAHTHARSFSCQRQFNFPSYIT